MKQSTTTSLSSHVEGVKQEEEDELIYFMPKRDLLQPAETGTNECGTNQSTGETIYCQNESECSNVEETAKLQCDCDYSLARIQKVVAGSTCQYEATMFCMIGEEQDSIPVKNTISFCTNNGTCKQFVKFGDR